MTHTKAPSGLTWETVEDPSGSFARIPLSGKDGAGRYVLLEESGARNLSDRGVRSLFLIGNGQGLSYPAFISRERRQMTVARALVGDPRNRRVEYVNGDRLDLRRRNLRVRHYDGVGECRAAGATA